MDLSEYYDVYAHEIRHLERQQEIGPEEWIRRYLEEPQFRLEEELIAYKAQMQAVKRMTKKMKDKDEYKEILKECCTNISSALYGNLITYEKAYEILK